MSYERIRGHAKALERLRGAIRHRRVAHGYLFSGPEGIGKRLIAREFARALLCGRGEDSCEKCPSCLHGAPGRLIEISRPKDKQDIVIDQIRELIRSLSFRHDASRVILLDDADRMNEESQNALLKTLEEPPEHTVLILVTALPTGLLPTIRSRCQTILFHPLPEAELIEHLKAEKAPEPEFLAALADGSLGRALRLAPDIAEWRTQATEFLTKALAGELNPIVEAVTRIKETEGQRERARLTLGVAVLALREALRASAGAPVRPLVAPPALLQTHNDPDTLADKIESLLDHLHYIDQNANVGLTVEDALLRM